MARQPHPKPVAPPAEGAAGWTLEEASVRINELKALTERANNDENVSLKSENEALQLREQMEMWIASAKRQLTETSCCVSVSAVAQFKSSIHKCNEALNTLENEFGNVLDNLRFWKKLSEINLINTQVIKKEQLVGQSKRRELSILGIAKTSNMDTLYFCDTHNANIKQLNLQTSQCKKVLKRAYS